MTKLFWGVRKKVQFCVTKVINEDFIQKNLSSQHQKKSVQYILLAQLSALHNTLKNGKTKG
jgi:hypothetical protein